jgi:hypothetical protein
MDMEEAPLMMEEMDKKSNASKGSKASKASKATAKAPAAEKPAGRPKATRDDFCSCCCCAFQVHDPTSREHKGCFCFPLKATIFWLIIVSFIFVVIELVLLVLLSKNKYYSGWYVFVEFLLLSPTFVGVAFFIYYLAEDTKASRDRVYQGF